MHATPVSDTTATAAVDLAKDVFQLAVTHAGAQLALQGVVPAQRVTTCASA
ncbi:MAG: hypothetical protein J0H27_04385 [Xanthomonadales bacterium]|mgnify:CR=1 FL=1|nr:hypothetical protein [Xanthomonadales bacterium]